MAITKRDRWTEDEVLALPSGEHDFLERKAGDLLIDQDFRQDMAKTLSALANSGGGHLLFGARNDGTFDGLPEFRGRQPIREWLEQVIPELLNYPLQDFRVHKVERSSSSAFPSGSAVIVIDVGDSMLAPHQSSVTKLYYYRVGGHSVPAPHFYLETLRGRDKFPGPKVVGAWFETVINPLLRALKNEQLYLARGKWTWKASSGSLSELTHLSDRPYYSVSENQEQLLEQRPEIGVSLKQHDAAVEDFRNRLAGLHEAVMMSPELALIYQEKTSPASLQVLSCAFPSKLGSCKDDAAIMANLFVGSDPAFHLDLLSRHIVNNEADLGVGFTTTAPLWNTYRSEFMAVLSAPTVAKLKIQLEESEEFLVVAVATLIQQLTETRRELARRYNVPYAEPSRSKNGGWPDTF
ncbi:MAG: ATP-binding protein [Acidobacteria bacterium]|nr:ATP-binding protein [Acidobacteriota bacterium]